MFPSPHLLLALESAHGIAAVLKRAPKMRPDQLIIANLSGRGDKDVAQAAEFLFEGKGRSVGSISPAIATLTLLPYDHPSFH